MDAATLIMVVTLADGSTRRRPDKVFDTVEACEIFRVDAEGRLAAGTRITQSYCLRHYKMAPALEK